jgi:hypothetical protein
MPCGSPFVHLGDFAAHPLRQIERVRDSLLDYADVERGLAVVARDHPLVDGADLGRSDVLDAHRVGPDVRHDDVVELLGQPDVGLRDDGELARGRLDAARRNLRVLPADRVFDVLHRELVRGEARAVEVDPHRDLTLAEDPDVGGAGEHGQPRLHVALDVVGRLERRERPAWTAI